MSKKAGDYWQNRFIELENRIKKEGIGDIKDLERRYQKAIYDVQKDLNVWYGRLAKNNGDISLVEARKLLNKNELEEFHWTVDEYIKHGKENALSKAWIKELENASAKTHIKRLEAIKLQTRQRVEELFAGREEQLAGTLKGAYKESFYRTGYELVKGTGVAMSFSKLDDNLVEKIIKTPWAPDGASFSSRIWKDKARLITELQAEVDRVCIAGVNPKSSINNIVNKLNASKANAKRLVMTELSAAQTRAQQSCMSDIGVERYKYVATLDLKTSEICAELDGKIFKMQDMQIGVNAPPMHPHCRSCTCPDIDSEWSGGKRAARGEDGKTYYVSADMKYRDWKDNFVDKNVEKSIKSGIIKSRIKNMETPKTLQNFNKHGERWENEVVKNYLDNDEIELIGAEIKRIIDENEFSMRVDHRDLEKILKDGKFKNQFETGKSGGTFDFAIRKRATKQLFGKSVIEDNADYEKYGYLGHKDFVEEIHNSDVSQYGNCIIRFDKKLLKNKTTYTVNDSLGMAHDKLTVAGDTKSPRANGISEKRLKFISNLLKSDEKPIGLTEFWDKTNIRYIELQYHGEIGTSLIKQVCFTNEYLPSDKVIEDLKKMGVDVFKIIGDWGGEEIVRI